MKSLFSKPTDRQVFAAPSPPAQEMREIERAFARCFSGTDGRVVMAWLQTATFQRAMGPETSESCLRHVEGQRALVATMLRMIDRGRTA